MKFLKTTAAALAIAAFAGNAAAQDTGAYINLGVDAVEFDAYNISGKVGYNVNEYFGVEGQAAFGIIDDEIDGVDAGIDSSFGAFGVVRFPAGENFDLFARAGYHFTQFGVSDGNVGVSLDTDGFAAGVGGQYFFTANDGIRVEYTYLDVNVDDDDADFEDAGGADVFSVSYVRKF